MTLPRRSLPSLLVCSLLAAASPAIAQGETATAGAPSGLFHRAVQWVASCLPGGADPAASGSAWWTAQVVESEAPAGLASPLANDPVPAEPTTAPSVGAVSSGNGGFEAPSSTDGTARPAGAKRTSDGVAGGISSTAAGSSTDVPEPGMLGLFAAGAIGLALRRRAGRKAAT